MPLSHLREYYSYTSNRCVLEHRNKLTLLNIEPLYADISNLQCLLHGHCHLICMHRLSRYNDEIGNSDHNVSCSSSLTNPTITRLLLYWWTKVTVIPFSYSPTGSNSYAFVSLFSVTPWTVECHSVCDNIGRENVKWCIRIADKGKNIETCISLNETQEVYESTCDAQGLDLQAHLSLPDVRQHNVLLCISIHLLSVFVPFS